MKKALLWGAVFCAMFLFAGCPEDEPEEPPQPFTLTVTGIALEKLNMPKTVGASLLKVGHIDISLATGTPSVNGANVTFTFYHPLPNSRLPSSTPFDTKGKYWVALAEVEMPNVQQPTATYFCSENGVKKEVSFPTGASFSWNDFEKED